MPCHSRRLLHVMRLIKEGGREEGTPPLCEESMLICMELSSLTLQPTPYLASPQRWVPSLPCAAYLCTSFWKLFMFFLHCSMLGDRPTWKCLASFMLLENKIDPDSSMHKTLANLIISLSPPSKILCHIRQLLLCNVPHLWRGPGGTGLPYPWGKPASLYGIEFPHPLPTTLSSKPLKAGTLPPQCCLLVHKLLETAYVCTMFNVGRCKRFGFLYIVRK